MLKCDMRREQAQEEEMRRMRAEVEQREADLENVKREVEQSLLDEVSAACVGALVP